ncbi:MAG: type II toxin-antitoxin system VapC family toxin [Albidovulum sp.]|nr:type II toxin-antitoxin system VapC family toxin [Albidovulum sp.]
MIVDTSALLAILFRESDAERYEAAILAAQPCRMSVANVLETSIVIESRGGAEAGRELDAYLESARIEAAPVTTDQLDAARSAWRRFVKGRHPAALNFGDCFAYALAQVTGEPLLYKGGDFARTEIAAAVPRHTAPGAK